MQVGGKVGECCKKTWIHGKPMRGLSVLSGDKGLVATACVWTNLGVECQVSHLGRPHYHDLLVCSWCLLYSFLGSHRSTPRGTYVPAYTIMTPSVPLGCLPYVEEYEKFTPFILNDQTVT